jgi:hypothetical protein
MQFYATAAYTCAPLAGGRIGIASCDNSSIADFSSFNGCKADVDFFGLAGL